MDPTSLEIIQGEAEQTHGQVAAGLFVFFFHFIYLFLALLSLLCCMGFSLVVASGISSLVAVLGLLIAVASLVEEHGL